MLTYLRASKSPTAEKSSCNMSGSHDRDRLLIFATPSNLGVLEDSERWYCNGTFSTSADVIYQVYTIHGQVSLTNTYITPLVYALLPIKKKETYIRLFQAPNLKPSTVTTDFEIAVSNAFNQLSTDVQISFCYFNFCQSLLRHVQNQSKKSRYGECEDLYRKYVRKAAALAFLPVKDVIKGFELLEDCNGDSDVSEFLKYYENTYIGVPQEIGTGTRAPRFAVSERSVYQAAKDRKSKTNNNVEAWNRIFNAVKVRHPNIPKLISHFKDSQKAVELKYEKINAGKGIS